VTTIGTRPALPLTDLAACCSPTPGQVLGQADAERLAAVLKALAEPSRLRLISMIAANTSGATCVCDLIEPVGLSQPTVSHHLKVLTDAGLVTREQRGKWAYYTLVSDALAAAAAAITPPCAPERSGRAGR
jgi:ArsR family transcriptional regulator